VVSQERAENQALLAEYFQRERIDVLKIVPSHLAALQTGLHPESVMPRSRLVLGGEASRLDWIARLRALAPGCEIYDHYGPTETTVGVLTYKVGSEVPVTQSGTLPLGSPLPNSEVHILDASGRPSPVGEQGELHIGGRGVGRGYLGRPDLTAEKFIADPFGSGASGSGDRLYRTGDVARVLPDGSLEFCGRVDDRSSCTATGSSWARSRARCVRSAACATPSFGRTTTRRAASSWRRTSCRSGRTRHCGVGRRRTCCPMARPSRT